MARNNELSGRQKAAILLITLGPEYSAELYKRLNEEEIEQLTFEIANMRKINSGDKGIVMEEFHQMVVAQEYINHGGVDYATDILEKAYGQQKALEVINRLSATLQIRPFDFARKSDANQILNFIQNEHSQTIALILSYLQPEQSSMILSSLPNEKQTDVARRVAMMGATSPDMINQVERVLEQKLSSTSQQDYTAAGGVETIVEILSGVDRSTERTILDTLEIDDPDLAEEIKKRMFIFEDIVNLDDRSIQRVIKDIENSDLQLSLKVASDEVQDTIFRNMSKRMAETFKEEMEYMGPVRLRDVEEAQTRIVSTIRRLEETGEVIIARGGDDVIV